MSQPTTPPVLDPIHLPLTGSRLIEASAGTGKTFTIALLYVRLVLGPRHEGDAESFPRALTPPEILVVTFTNAATRELRDRIRARLVEAADVFLAPSPGAVPESAASAPISPDAAPEHTDAFGETGDLFAQPAEDASATAPLVGAPSNGAPSNGDPTGGDPLIALRDSYPRERWPACARRLRLAAEWMDEAAVSTIHSWCHRVLREHAFESGSLFSLEMNLDQSELELEVARDYWRSFYYALPAEALAEVTRYWKSPDELALAARRLRGELALLPEAPPPAEALTAIRETRERMLGELKAPWPVWLEELSEQLERAAAAKAFDQRSLNGRNRANWLSALRDWASDPALASPALTPAAWKRLTPEGMAEIWKAGEPPDHPALHALAELPARIEALPDAHGDLLAHAARWMDERRERMQHRRAELGPDDLLTRLDRALEGPAGASLAEHVRAQFPVALVDEFQDTDPVQYRLFDHIYRLNEARGDSAILLIGDPKQAIYAFRGADIHTYLRARRDTEGRHATLGTNFRSSTAMVEAVNRVFLHAERRPEGRGAFLFREPDGENPLPFLPVKAKGRKDSLTRDGAPLPALTLWHLQGGPVEGDATLSKGAYLDAMAARCASHMVALLDEGRAGRTGFSQPDQPLRTLQPSDLAVLVNNAGEARAIRAALLARGVRSVYLSDKESVFDTEAAWELEVWLTACAEPESERRLHAALATPSLGLSLAELDALQRDELAWEERVLQFRHYHHQWRSRGVLPMLLRLLADFGVPARLLASASGERHLTDLLHLGELLQESGEELDGEHALLRHLSEARAQPPGDAESHRLRLESDADLVQVVTIHKSKGLEYPLVFLPFICAFRAVKSGDRPLIWHDEGGHKRLSFAPDEAALTRADEERLGEDLRKLYVALTRARHATWLGIAPLKELERSAIGLLLSAGRPLAPNALGEALAPLAHDDTLAIAPAPEANDAVLPAEARHETLRDALTPRRRAREHWWIASYSALTLGDGRIGGGEGVLPAELQPASVARTEPATVPFAEPDAAPFMEPEAAPFMEPEAVSFMEPEAAPFTEPTTVSFMEPEAAPFMEPEAAPFTEPATVSFTEPATALEATAREVFDEPRDPAHLHPPAQESVSGFSLHRFPRGPAAGTFLHGLLEWAGSEGFAGLAADPRRLDDTLARRANLRGWRDRIPALQAWLRGLLGAEIPLPDAPEGPVEPLRLDALASAHYRVEMEFWFATHRVDTRELDALVSAYTLGGASRPALSADTLNGMLKGFIDLVVEHQGRFYVLDWKSNYLGRDDDAYSEAALRDAVLEKRYDLQYCLYLLALHRLLESRLPGYDIDRHLGGALHVFLRGQHAPSRGVHRERPPRELIERLDALFRAPDEETPAWA